MEPLCLQSKGKDIAAQTFAGPECNAIQKDPVVANQKHESPHSWTISLYCERTFFYC